MPELPEVETIKRSLAAGIVGKTIKKVITYRHKLRWAIPQELSQMLAGQAIVEVMRRAKYLLFKTTKGTLIVHFGMSGSMSLLAQYTLPGKHDHLDIFLADGKVLRYNDPRRFGCVLWTQHPETHELLQHLGVEPLEKKFNASYLYQHSRNRKVAVKLLLMDSHTVVGIGNIYANEALFLAHLYPLCKAASLTKAECELLVKCIKKVLKQAIVNNGTTFRDFKDGNGRRGRFAELLYVYGREGLPCKICSNVLRKMIVGNRSTVYCPHCQKI